MGNDDLEGTANHQCVALVIDGVGASQQWVEFLVCPRRASDWLWNGLPALVGSRLVPV